MMRPVYSVLPGDAEAMTDSEEPKARAFRPEESVPYEDICVRLTDCECVVPGPISETALDALNQKAYDQAPVYDRAAGRFWGLASTDYLRSLYDKGAPLNGDDPNVRDEAKVLCFNINGDIYQLLDRLRSQPAIVVIRESDATEHGHVEFLLGLFTRSDLNRHEIRAILYRLLSEAEALLARLIEREVHDPWEWLPLLTEEHQVRALGYWELSKKRNVNIGPLASLTLTQLLTIVAKYEALRVRLGFKRRREIDSEIGPVPDFRNRIMHPVRPLILNAEDVDKAYKVARFLENIRDALESEEKGATRRRPGEGQPFQESSSKA